MASRSFQLGVSGGDPEQFFRAMAPTQLMTTVNQVISLLSMTRDPASVPGQIDEILTDEIRWLERTVADAPNAKAAAERLAGKLGEGLDLDEEPDVDEAEIPPSGKFTDGARLNVRNAIYFCWTALPEDRQAPAEAGRIVRLAVSRQFAMIEELRREILRS